MGELEAFIENIKQSFSRVKSHIKSLESEIENNRNYLIEHKKELNALKEKIELILANNGEKKPEIEEIKESSTGNEGVHSFIHSFNHSLTHSLNTQSNTKNDRNLTRMTNFKKEVKDTFSQLPNKEFLVFLTIYQLEEELGKVSYSDLSKYLKLSQGCIRSYISSLLKKNIPIAKYKVNNKLSLLKIDPQFRELNLKKELMNLYFDSDADQSKLDRF